MARPGQGYNRESFQQGTDCLFSIAGYHVEDDTASLCLAYRNTRTHLANKKSGIKSMEQLPRVGQFCTTISTYCTERMYLQSSQAKVYATCANAVGAL